MNAEKILDYDKLVDAYSANLDVTLRGFRPAEEMLDTWVPDDDAVRSLASLVEAAQLCGCDAVAVRISRKTLESNSTASPTEKLASLGEVEVTEEKDSVVFTVSRLQETAAFRSVRPIYQQKLRARAGQFKFRRVIKVADNHVPLRATEAQHSLAWAVQPDTHIISDAVFDGTSSGPMLAVLDCLCETVIGLPILEARDHAVIRLEFALRSSERGHPVSGIVLPQNADPLFRLPFTLVNRLFDDYRTATSYQPGVNFHDPGPGAAWKALTPEERKVRVTAALAAHGSKIGLTNGDSDGVQVVECDLPYAVTVRFGDHLSISFKRRIALAVERLVRGQCDPRLEVFCEEKKDLSKLRRMTS